MSAIKELIKKSGIFAYFRKRRTMHDLLRWSGEDELRLNFYKEFIQPGDLVFDVGANMGNRSKIFLKLGAKVIAFEPQNICARFLNSAFEGNKNFILVQKGLGAEDGEAEMFIGDENTISTLSGEWVEATKKSGRFKNNKWDKKERIKITTLDKAIAEFGKPSFIKIDVEGFEYQVLKGISKPVNYISIEFAAENIANTLKCIDYLKSLWDVSFQFSKAEQMGFNFPSWISAEEIKASLLSMIQQDSLAWGDVYIKQLNA